MKSVEEAASEILAAFPTLGPERVALLDALDRYAASDVYAQTDLPPFDNSAMDGYALNAPELRDSDAAKLWPVRGESRAGSTLTEPLSPGCVQRIFTGAPLPAGADSVEMQENVERSGEYVRFTRPLSAGANVRRRGSDVANGERVLRVGTRLGSGEIALLAALGCASVDVHRRPRVAIVCTGDELRDIGEPARPGSIINSNAYALAAQVREAGAEPWLFPPVGDVREEIARAVTEALRADVVVLSGGVSVGEYDLVRQGLADAGVTLSFWSVRMKPGKPVSFALSGRTPVLGLPGNPVSTWVTFELFVRPGLRKMLGDPAPHRRKVSATLAADLQRRPGRTEFARARVFETARGLSAELLAKQSSGALSSLVGVDALVEIPADCAALPAGSEVTVHLVRAPLGQK